ncbi:TPA: hypothetical protein U2I64_004094 [Providencia stuartii]|nr:hypothetical protein [Providencia rettgeri]HEM6871590.1 hypothetical protein [Providencia stuartii]HEM7175265.1 hypothetical protein [Providencia stuartii]
MNKIIYLFLVFPCICHSNGNVSSNIEISASIKSVCTIDMPTSVEIHDIPIIDLSNLNPGNQLEKYQNKFTINTECYGATNYSLEFIANNSQSSFGCLNTSPSDILYFCLKDDNGKLIDFSNGNVVINGYTKKKEINVVPAKGILPPKPGNYVTSITVKIEPK